MPGAHPNHPDNAPCTQEGGTQPHPEQTAGASALTLDSVPGWMLASSSQSPTDILLQPRPLTGDPPSSRAPLTPPAGMLWAPAQVRGPSG